MNVKLCNITAYENKRNWTLGENKPNSKPIQTQSNPICRIPKMSVSSILTKDYERNDIFAVPENKANSNPIQNFSGQMGIIIYINDLTGVVSSALSVKLYCPRGEGNCTIKEYPGYNVEAAA